MNRKKLNQIRNSFQRIFSLTEQQAKSPEMVALRQQALTRVSIWDGRFPGEVLEDAVNVRQMDKGSRQDNPHELANYLRRLNCVGDEKDDWSCIFYAFKNYVFGHESTKDLELANKLFGGQVHEKEEEDTPVTPLAQEEISEPTIGNTDVDVASQNHEESERATESVTNKQEVQEGADSLPHRTPEESTENKVEEKEKLAMSKVSEVEALLQQEANGTVAPTVAPTMSPEAPAAVSSANNSIDISSVSSANMAGVSRVVDQEWADRTKWSSDRKIVKVLCAGKPAAYKLMEYTGPNSNIMGELANDADKVLENIAKTMYSVDQNKRTNGGKTLKKEMPQEGVGYIYDETNKTVKIPECVRKAGQAAMDDFRTVVETLVAAGKGKPEFKVKITNSKPSITAVAIQVADGRTEQYKLAELRDLMVTSSNLSLEYVNYNPNDAKNKHSLLAATAVSKINAKKIEDQGSYVKLVFGNRGEMFDVNTGDVSEYGAGIVDFIREITNEEDTNPRAVTSETGFQYKTPENKLRTYSLRVTAKTKAVHIVEQYQGLVGASAGGNVVKINDDSARKETMKLLNAITVKAPASAVAQKVTGVTMQGSSSADAALAGQAVGNSGDYES